MFQPNAGVKNQLAAMQLRRLVKFCFQRTDYVISFGGKIRQIVEQLKVPSKRIIEMPLGIEREWLVDSVTETVLPVQLLFVGRFERRKGIPELNEVMRLSIAHVPVEFHLAGPIPEEVKLHHPLIHYHGPISDRESMQKLYRQCDILISPSLAEGMPTVIVEAMASGLSVIATDVGAVSQMVNAENGWLVSPGDISAMHKAIQSACKHPEELTAKKAAALKWAGTHLLWENVILDLIREVELRLNKN
jgi:glycosyltransferase involved in cell wall biosynthesis